MYITAEKIVTACSFIAALQQKGFLTEKEFSELEKYPIRMKDNECGWTVKTPDREFALIFDEDCSGALVMDLFTDGIKYHGTYDKRNCRFNFDLFEYEKLLENFYINI